MTYTGDGVSRTTYTGVGGGGIAGTRTTDSDGGGGGGRRRLTGVGPRFSLGVVTVAAAGGLVSSGRGVTGAAVLGSTSSISSDSRRRAPQNRYALHGTT